MNWLENTAFAIKVFERPQMAQRCIKSIRRLWPDARIYAADDSKEPLPLRGLTGYIRLPFDVGCSAGRNALINGTTEPYLVHVDDDYVFTKETDIPRMIELLEAHDHLVMAGCKCRHVRKKGAGWTKYYADVTLEGGTLFARQVTRKHTEPDGLVWFEADTISNFWVAKRRLFDHVLWDERLKIGGEHADFFQRIQASNGDTAMRKRQLSNQKLRPAETSQDAGRLGVAFIPSMWVEHYKKRPPHYQPFRARDSQYERLYRQMWGITRVKRWRYGRC